MTSISYPFTNAANYTFDPAAIEIVSDKAQLILSSAGGQVFNEDFTDNTGFVYDNTKAEFIGALVRQRLPGDTTFFNDFNTDKDANYGGGAITGTLIGGATVALGVLNLKGGTTKYVDYSAVDNADSLQVGCIRFNYIPNYAGSPSVTQVLFSIAQADGNSNNRIQLIHLTTGAMRIIVNDDVGGTIFQSDLPLWAPTLGQSYEFEVNYDLDAGASRVFRDGVQTGATSIATGTRSGAVGLLRVGNNHTGSGTSEFEIDNFSVFSAVQHTAGYTPGTFPPTLGYSESEVELPLFTHAGAGQILSLDGLVTTEVGIPHYTFELNGGDHLYWSGSAWVTSNDTYAQANNSAIANANLPTFPVPVGATLLHVHVYFPDGNTQASVDDLTVTHTGNTIFNITNPTIVPNTSVSQDALLSFLATLTAAGLDAVQFTLQVDGQEKYWNGSAWVDADGTYAQTNDLATIQANLAAFTDRGDLVPVIYLHSDDGSTTPDIDNIEISFDFYGGPAIGENVCTIWGYLFDELNAPIVGADIIVTPNIYGLSNDKMIHTGPFTVVTDSTGYWEIKLIETATGKDNWSYNFSVNGNILNKYVPNELSANFNILVDALC